MSSCQYGFSHFKNRHANSNYHKNLLVQQEYVLSFMPFSVLRLIKRPGDRPIPEPSGRLLPGSLSHKTHQSVQGGKFRNSPPRVERADSFLRYAP